MEGGDHPTGLVSAGNSGTRHGAGFSRGRPRGPAGVPPRHVLLLIVAAVCTLVIVLVAVSIQQDRERRLEAAKREAATLVRVLEEQTGNLLQAANLALIGIVESLKRDPAPREHDPAFEDGLRRLVGSLPAVRALFVIGPDGFIVQDSDPDTPRRNLADRDYFQAHAGTSDAGLFVGPPVLSRSVGTWFISLSRRLEAPRGGFAGVAVAAVDVRYFERFYGDLGLGADDVITLETRDGILVARQPQAAWSRIGQPLVPSGRSLLQQALARGNTGSFDGTSAIDGARRIFGYRALSGGPLVVLVGLAEQRVLAPWRQSAAAVAAATAAALLLSGLLLWLAMRHARHEAAARVGAAEAAKLEAVGRLTSGVAHDFNNLLTAMGAALELLGRRTGEDERAAMIVRNGQDAVERGRGLVAQLLSVVRRQDDPIREVDINAVLSAMAPLLRTAVASRAKLVVELAPDLSRCRVDASRLDAAVLNLVMNACDAMPADSDRTGMIRVEAVNCAEDILCDDGRTLDGHRFIRVTVSDDGPGMPPEVRERALEPFFTTKGEHGTGLGLAQVNDFVTETGGTLAIDSEIGNGTTVHLYLPRA